MKKIIALVLLIIMLSVTICLASDVGVDPPIKGIVINNKVIASDEIDPPIRGIIIAIDETDPPIKGIITNA